MAAPRLSECDRVLVVEGYSDLHFYAEMLRHLGRLDGVFIQNMNGKQSLEAKLEDFLRPDLLQEKHAIAVIVDADDNPQGTCEVLTTLLRSITGQNVVAGAWSGGSPRIGLFVTPDNQSKGELETPVWQTWAADTGNAPARACIETYRDCMATLQFTAKSPEKGLISSLLAIRSDEDPRLGPGARDRKFDLAAAGFAPLRAFLSQL